MHSDQLRLLLLYKVLELNDMVKKKKKSKLFLKCALTADRKYMIVNSLKLHKKRTKGLLISTVNIFRVLIFRLISTVNIFFLSAFV